MNVPTLPPAVVPRGLRNNNPGNLRYAGKLVWYGEIEPDSDGYCRFPTPALGLRALFITFRTYQEVHRLKSPRLMILRFAPPTENNVEAYVQDVCERGPFHPDWPVDLEREGLEWLRAVVHHELGADPYTLIDYTNAIHMANLR